MMYKFWRNIVRYFRFLITSVIGLIFILLVPFKNLVKIKKFRKFFLFILGIFFLILYFVFKNMFAI